jgi:O-antigen/teichoic acid export membrane protein
MKFLKEEPELMSSLRQQALSGAFWSFAERFGLLGVQFIVSIILARILSPAEFGLVAMITIFSLLAQLVVTSGFGQALVQKKDCSHLDESTAFWFNVFLGLLMMAVLYFAASGIARFYGEVQLVPITRVASFSLFVNSLGVVQNALIQKELLFKNRTIASVAGILISGIVSIMMALKGFGVWALAWQMLLNNVIRTGMLWMLCSWRPLFRFSSASFRALFQFGSKMLLSGLLATVFDNIYLLIIGKLYSATDLGFYQRAKEFVVASSNSLSTVIAQVNYPVLSKLQSDPRQMKNAFSQILQHALFVIFPLMVGIGVCAPNIIMFLLGEKWLPSIPYLRLLCVVGALFPIHLLNLNILMALGRSDLFLRLEIVKRVLLTAGILIAFRHGIIALLVAQIASSVIALFLNSHYSKKLLSYGLGKQIGDNAKVLGSSMAMGIFVYFAGKLSVGPVALALSMQVLLGALLFVAASWLLKDPVFSEWSARGLAYLRSKRS